VKASATFAVPCGHGLHLSDAKKVVEEVQGFKSSVLLSLGELTVDARAVLTLLQLAPLSGHRIKISASGPDATRAVQAIAQIFESRKIGCPARRDL